MVPAILHAATTIAALVCYTVLTALGHDASVLLGIPVGQGAAIAAQRAGGNGAASA